MGKEAKRPSGASELTVTCNVNNDYIRVVNRRSLRFLQGQTQQVVEFTLIYTGNKDKGEVQAISNSFITEANRTLAKAETCSSIKAAGVPVTAVNNVVPTSSMSPSGKPSVSSKPSRKPSGKPSGRPSKQPSGKPSLKPSRKPSGVPSSKPSRKPSGQPSGKPSSVPSGAACAVTEAAISQDTFNTRIATYKSTTVVDPLINTWNTADVTNMEGTFQSFTTADPNVRCWNVEKVTTMKNMFNGATKFMAANIAKWNVERVSDMSGMFNGATEFNWDIDYWNADKVTTTKDMFKAAEKFNA